METEPWRGYPIGIQTLIGWLCGRPLPPPPSISSPAAAKRVSLSLSLFFEEGFTGTRRPRCINEEMAFIAQQQRI